MEERKMGDGKEGRYMGAKEGRKGKGRKKQWKGEEERKDGRV
jgi:hypothetical protein